MRGKVAVDRTAGAFDGITPAHAGKSSGTPKCRIVLWDHPRTCGEKYLVLLYWDSEMGSPPHMRGKEDSVEYLGMSKGITPAHAGKST